MRGPPTRTHTTGMEMPNLPSLTQHNTSPTTFAFHSPPSCFFFPPPPCFFFPPLPLPPALTPSRPQNNTLNILQINTNGMRNKIMELRVLLHEQRIHIATIQESKLTTTITTPSFPGYTTLRHDRPIRGGGGLLTLIHKDIPFTNTTAETHAQMPPDPTLEIQSTRIQIHKHHYNIHNIYIPPTDSTPPGYTPSLNYLNTITDSYILGDFNAHDPVWLTKQNTDTRATTLQEQLDSYIILNNPHTPTRKPFNTNTSPTSPDISFASPNRSSWHTLHDLSSDHIPILITYRLHAPVEHKQRRTFTNYNRAQWDTFTSSVDNHLQSFEINNYTSIDAATKTRHRHHN